jgi:hypothetical protein
MKQMTCKWKRRKDGTMVMKWKRRKVRPLTILDVLSDNAT